MGTEPTVFLYESFGARRFGGNVASVVISDHPLPLEDMQGLASDLASPTTGFIARDGTTTSSATIRFFTPNQEIDACGHVTIAAARALVEIGTWPSEGVCRIDCAGGEFEIGCDGTNFTMTQALAFSREPVSTPDEIAELLGQPVAGVAIRGTGLRHLFVDLGSIERLRMVQLEHERLSSLGRANEVDTIGLYAVVDESTVRLRDITAPIGVLEEPASGTTCGALGLLRGPGTTIVQQGVEMGRPSRIVVRATPPQVTVTGSVRRVLSGVLEPT